MSTYYAWMALYFVVLLAVNFLFPRRIFRGRILTRPFVRHLFPGAFQDGFGYLIAGLGVRLAQIALIQVPMAMLVGPGWIGWPIAIAPYADDILTGGDDWWRKRWHQLKNAVKWKMVIPDDAPA